MEATRLGSGAVDQKVDKAFSRQQTTEHITEQNSEQTNKQIEPELQFKKQDAALAQGPEQGPDLIALRMEYIGGESYGRRSERGSEIRTAESAKIDLAGSSMVVQADGHVHRKPCHMLKEQQSASESPRKESKTREQQGREGLESLLELLYHERLSGEHMTANNELGNIGVPVNGTPNRNSDYLNDSSLMFLYCRIYPAA
ncbi:hypothetical protein NDU88_003925 [Pleurodeles waltl]|uniref:Uncharacterized protein n=1 Tax=Pleurodeles waltl TaxID=8319 RepID=A0AAV7RJK1_PLEWA|nr:hypothetical protein NDU88_003925 [Pleurodeles waltl]